MEGSARVPDARAGLLEALGYRRTGRKLPLRVRSARTLRNITLPLLEKAKWTVNKITRRWPDQHVLPDRPFP